MAHFIELTQISKPFIADTATIRKIKLNVDSIQYYHDSVIVLVDRSINVQETYEEITKLIEKPIVIEDIQQAADNLVNNEWRERKEHLLDMIRKQTLAVVINKACTWLEKNLVRYWYDEEGFLNEEGLLEDFKKALSLYNEEET